MVRWRTLPLILPTLIAVALAGLAAPSARAQSPESIPTAEFVEEVLARFGIDPGHETHLLEGRILTSQMPDLETQPNDLAVGAVLMLVRRPLEVVAEALVDDVILRVNTEILDYGSLGTGDETPEEVEQAFGVVRYTAAEETEARRLLAARPGTEFNLSHAELAHLHSRADEGGSLRTRASNRMGEILLARYRGYLAKGLGAIAPYARSKKEMASPRRELTRAFESLELVKRYFPSFHESFFGYPQGTQEGVIHRFFWAKRDSDDRPAYVLSHRTEHAHDRFVIAGELQYYVGHSYNSMLSMIACVPSEDGTLVLSISHLFTDQVTGLGSGIKKRVGRGRLVEAVAELFGQLRKELERPTRLQ